MRLKGGIFICCMSSTQLSQSLSWGTTGWFVWRVTKSSYTTLDLVWYWWFSLIARSREIKSTNHVPNATRKCCLECKNLITLLLWFLSSHSYLSHCITVMIPFKFGSLDYYSTSPCFYLRRIPYFACDSSACSENVKGKVSKSFCKKDGVLKEKTFCIWLKCFRVTSERHNSFLFSKPRVLQHLFPFNCSSHCFFVCNWCYYFIRSDAQYSFKAILLQIFTAILFARCSDGLHADGDEAELLSRFSVFLDREVIFVFAFASALNAMRNAALFELWYLGQYTRLTYANCENDQCPKPLQEIKKRKAF